MGILSYFYKKYKDLALIENILKYLRPAIVVMILIAGLDIGKTALFGEATPALASLDIKMLGIFIGSLIIMLKKDLDPIKVMLAGGAAYLLLTLVF